MDTGREREGKIQRLHALDEEAAALRKELGLSKAGGTIFRESISINRTIIVTATGYGEASVQVVDGEDAENSNVTGYRRYPTEDEAIAKASGMWEAGEDESALESDEEPR